MNMDKNFKNTLEYLIGAYALQLPSIKLNSVDDTIHFNPTYSIDSFYWNSVNFTFYPKQNLYIIDRDTEADYFVNGRNPFTIKNKITDNYHQFLLTDVISETLNDYSILIFTSKNGQYKCEVRELCKEASIEYLKKLSKGLN
jgi:hypothetical protein